MICSCSWIWGLLEWAVVGRVGMIHQRTCRVSVVPVPLIRKDILLKGICATGKSVFYVVTYAIY